MSEGVRDDTPKHLREFDFAVAQLRHAYTHLMRWNMTEFATGLISPQIKTMERLRAQGYVKP